jgi:hypothetical protein
VSRKALFASRNHLILARCEIIQAERRFRLALLSAERLDVIKLSRLVNQVVTPKSDTRNQFIARIAAGLSQITSGNWDALEQRDPEKISRLQWWRSHAETVLRTVFLASLPGLLWWALQQASLAPKKVPVAITSVFYFWCFWAAMTFLIAYDPHFWLKATALKEIVQSLPGLGSLLGKDKK